MGTHNPPYTQDEQKNIVDHIVKNDLIHRTKGDAIWKIMEEDKVTSRTWQSMKQHYRKTIAWQLNRPHFGLDGPTLQQFQKANNTVAKRTNTSRKKDKVARTRKHRNFSKLSFSSSDSKIGVRPLQTQTQSNAQNESNLSTFESETEPNRDVDMPNTGDLQQSTEDPTTSQHLQQSTRANTSVICISSSDTDLDLDPESQDDITMSAQDGRLDSIEVDDDTNDSVQVIGTTVDCIVVNDMDSEIVEVI